VRLAPLPSLVPGALGVLMIALLGGCPPAGGAPSTDECLEDNECGSGEVCARDNLCYRAAEVRFVKTTWTLRGQPASATTCGRYPDLYIEFRGSSVESLGFSPVPCANGQFSVDKLPRGFTRVELGVDNGGPWSTASIGSTDTAAIDLAF
jgi:hypothetical protein